MTDTQEALRAVVADASMGALVTVRRDGRPQISDVVYGGDGVGPLRVSVTDDRAKTRNLRRDPRASLHVRRADGWGYAVAEGRTRLSPVAAAPDDATVEALVELYREVSGEHPDWDEFRGVMVRERRLLLTIDVERLYGTG